MPPQQRTVQWVGGPQDGAYVAVPYGATWVAVLEDRRSPAQLAEPTSPSPRALMRYTVPIIDHKIVWAQRVEADPGSEA
jgi:hypothetical protein